MKNGKGDDRRELCIFTMGMFMHHFRKFMKLCMSYELHITPGFTACISYHFSRLVYSTMNFPFGGPLAHGLV